MKARYALLLLAVLLNEAYSAKLRTRHRRHCLKCPPGWGVKTTCTLRRGTECERCTPGETYSSEYSTTSSCWKCSRCGVGLYEARQCTTSTDTVCDDCTRVMYNPDVKKIKDFRESCGYLFLN